METGSVLGVGLDAAVDVVDAEIWPIVNDALPQSISISPDLAIV